MDNQVGSGYDLQSNILTSSVELILQKGWGDCPSGCIYHHNWKYQVQFDCSVEFIESNGDPINSIENKSLSGEHALFIPTADGRFYIFLTFCTF